MLWARADEFNFTKTKAAVSRNPRYYSSGKFKMVAPFCGNDNRPNLEFRWLVVLLQCEKTPCLETIFINLNNFFSALNIIHVLELFWNPCDIYWLSGYSLHHLCFQLSMTPVDAVFQMHFIISLSLLLGLFKAAILAWFFALLLHVLGLKATKIIFITS